MKSNHIIAFASILALALASCNEDAIDTFDREECGIYFQYGGPQTVGGSVEVYYDSLYFSFSLCSPEIKDTTLYTMVKTMGNVKDYDRPFTLTFNKETTTAVEGTHFTIDQSACVIPAGQSKAKVGITLHRAEDLLNNEVSLYLKLEDNEHFKVYFTTQNKYNYFGYTDQTIRADEFVFAFGESYYEPFYWMFAEEFLGPWSIAKFQYFNTTLGINPADWDTAGSEESKVSYSRMAIYASILQKALQAAANSGNPVLDSDGSFMQLASAYQVDYSGCL